VPTRSSRLSERVLAPNQCSRRSAGSARRHGRSDATSHDHLKALRLIRTAPSLVPHQLAILAAEEKALAEAITERLDPAGTAPSAVGPSAMSGHTPIYPMLCAAAALAALRLVLHRWLDRAAGPDTAPPLDALRREIDQALAELATGLDRPGITAAENSHR
jgi:hypothetical protein